MKFPFSRPQVNKGTAIVFAVAVLLVSGCGGGGGGTTAARAKFSPPCATGVAAPILSGLKTHILAAWNEGLRRGHSVWERTAWVVTWKSRDWFSLRSAFAAFSATVSGTVTFEKKLYNSAGFTGATQFEPARYAVVEIVDAANGTTVIGTAATDANGNYTATINFTTTPLAYVRVLSELDMTASGGIQAQVLNASGAIYAPTTSASPFSITSGGTYTGKDLTVTVASDAAGAFNILNDFVTGGQVLISRGVSTPTPMITAYWEVGGADGTYYFPLDSSIHLCGGGGSTSCTAGDTDEFDDAVILHEYGHYVADQYSRDDSTGGDHSIVEHTQDIRLSWSEGWASFWSAAVRKQGGDDPTFVDTVGSSAFSFDISGGACTGPGSPPMIIGSSDCTSGYFVMTTNEVAVSNVLWNIFDPSSSGVTFSDDSGLAAIWDVFKNYIPTAPANDATLESFWDGWFSRGHGSQTALDAITNNFRGMAFCADSSEPNDTSGTPTIISSVPSTVSKQTLYTAAGADKDYFSAALTKGVTYTIKTTNLNNGADTVLSILNSVGTMLKSNDNPNDSDYSSCTASCPSNNASALASSVVFRPSVTGAYTILVQHSSGAPPSAGRYGGYDLTISTP